MNQGKRRSLAQVSRTATIDPPDKPDSNPGPEVPPPERPVPGPPKPGDPPNRPRPGDPPPSEPKPDSPGPVHPQSNRLFCRRVYLFGSHLGIVAILALFVAVALGAESIDDNDILEAVENELRSDDVVTADTINVRVNGGVVTLSGHSFSLFEKRRVVSLIGSLRGVRSIVNAIDVQPTERSDEQIVADAQAALRDDPVADEDEVQVKVSDGRVILEGTVNSFAERRISEATVAGVRGVLGIENRTVIRADTTRPDEEIKPEIRRRFEQNPYLEESLIKVEVKNGRVTLHGMVHSLNEKSLAHLLSWVSGVRRVDNASLKVQPTLSREFMRKKSTILRNDAQIQDAVKDALIYDPRVRGNSISVRVRYGVVSLTGNVAVLAAKRAAEQDAKNTLGVRRVINHLKVKPAAWPNDIAVTQRAQEALNRDAHLAHLDIRASSRHGKVHLSGSSNTYFEKGRAEFVVANVPGALDIVNRISVDFEWQAKPDFAINEDVKRRLRWSPLLDADLITVSVINGVVTLRGIVDTYQQRNAVVKHARQGGAKRVVDELRVRTGRITPAGLKATLIPQQRVYTLKPDHQGEAFRHFLKAADEARDYQRLPPAPEVNFVFQLQNEGDEPVEVRLGHDAGGLEVLLAGDGAVHIELARPFAADFHAGTVQTIEPGETFDIPIRSMQYGFRSATNRWYWTEPGEYTLHVTLTWPRERSGLFGEHAVSATPVKLTVEVQGETK